MQFSFLCLFTILCGYSLVIAAPVSQNQTDSLETKQQKATAIASRLLKELANEQSGPFHHGSNSKISENENIVQLPKTSENQVESNEEEDEEMAFLPAFDDLYQIYSDRFGVPVADEESSIENNDEEQLDEFPLSDKLEQKLINYLSEEQDESNELLTPALHSPMMDDTVMTAENHHHQQQRRRRSIY